MSTHYSICILYILEYMPFITYFIYKYHPKFFKCLWSSILLFYMNTMKHNNKAKRLFGHISVVGTFLILVIGLLLENCLEVYNPITAEHKATIKQIRNSRELKEK